MRAKKSIKADVDRHKGLFFRTGLLLSILFVIWAFRLQQKKKHSFKYWNELEDETLEIPPIDFPDKKMEQPKPQAFKLNKKDDDEDVDNSQSEKFNSDFNPFDPDLIIEVPVEKYTGPTERIFTIPEKMPMFPGGEEALFAFLKDNIVYPQIERKLVFREQ